MIVINSDIQFSVAHDVSTSTPIIKENITTTILIFIVSVKNNIYGSIKCLPAIMMNLWKIMFFVEVLC